MVFLLYFKNQQEAEKATLYEKFNEKIIKKYDDNFLKIELADDGRNPSEIIKDFLNKDFHYYLILIFSLNLREITQDSYSLYIL